MLTKATAQLVEEVMGHFGEEKMKKARENPEACLIAMLTLIKNELPEVSATLYSTIELATYDGYLKEAKEKMQQSK
ncbi:MAG: hypothetical protein A3D44_03765 [Candidatus Staskawiczbacteria bacterium RIFCSPHIGHO2_02_FULL_42_22]|uniref:Uncharacterized protein n=1 Tax=Candidatus Staskawiczbacteria bacterium RIFCSPHIGHO2_02_FULL_42_22 TaxID=1802207 RepID=A0A1G2I3Y3_9BACT|nr:MAG: hypothetical protein A3D44_03765 [Candidatus Staskawiczbacteria bacterium RIFCSPHIGHO2_02_FULL_42_22]